MFCYFGTAFERALDAATGLSADERGRVRMRADEPCFQLRIVSRPEEGVAQPVGANEFGRYLRRGSESQGGI